MGTTDGPHVTAAALRTHEKRVKAMLTDPDLVGDLLLIGLGLARWLDLGDPAGDVSVFGHIARVMYGTAEHGPVLAQPVGQIRGQGPRIATQGNSRVRDVVRADIRRYVPDGTAGRCCQRPVTRRPHKPTPAEVEASRFSQTVIYTFGPTPEPKTEPYEEPCGRNTDHTVLLTDPANGTVSRVAACSQPRCKSWLDQLRENNQRELADHPAPAPAANRGGVLERHLDEIDWPAIYLNLDPGWKPPHEEPGWRPPKLQILIGDDEPDPVVGKTPRPALTVIEGGWR